MTIKMLNGCAGREVNAGIMTSALLKGCTLRGRHPLIYFDVPDWRYFCSIVWNTYSEFSKDCRGKFIEQRVAIGIIMPDGREFHTLVWYDAETKGLRYVSLL